MSGQSKDALGVCNVKIRKSLMGAETGLIFKMLRITSSSIEQFEIFFMASMLMLSLAVVNTFWPITSRSRLVHGCIHGPYLSPWILANTAWILLKMLVGDLWHKLSIIMLIRGAEGIGYIGHRDTGGNGVHGVWGIWAMRPTGGMGYRGIWGTWAIGAQGVWGTRGMGHIGNRSHGQWGTWAMGLMGPMGNGAHGPHGQWGSWAPWAMGPMGDLNIFAHNIIKFYLM